MPPRRRVSVPANRVYKSATPKQQAKFPSPKRRIRSYGKQSGGRKLKKDNTLTQMDFIKLLEQQKAQRKEESEEEEEEEDSSYEEQAKKRKTKRRRTMGDKSEGTLKFQQQTLTQIIDRNLEEAPEEDIDGTIFDGSSSSQSAKLPKTGRKRLRSSAAAEKVPQENLPLVQEMPTPRTPRRILPQEIPSSQSPATPMSIHTRGPARRSPLKEKSMNIPIPFNPSQKFVKSPLKSPKLEVRDTFDAETDISEATHIPSSAPKRSSPAKSVRFAIPEAEQENQDAGDVNITSPSIKRKQTPYPASQNAVLVVSKLEILDSDAESDEEEEHESEETFTPPPEQEDEPGLSAVGSEQEDEPKPEDNAGPRALQDESRDQELSILREENSEGEEPEPETCYGDDIGPETQFEVDRLVSSSEMAKSSTGTQAETQTAEEAIQEKTQIMESQRLGTQHMTAMAPRTLDSDVFISISPQNVENILNRVKNHETRNWSLPPTVCRLWMYEFAPVSKLRYMAEIGPAKRPCELLDERGMGNVEFNAKKGSWRAYEILQMYALADPYPLTKLIANEWLKDRPNKWSKVRPAALDEMMANLMHPIFDVESQDLAPISSLTDRQEVEAQLISETRQSTQPPLLLQRPSSPQIKPEPSPQREIIPSSQRKKTSHHNSMLPPRSSQAETVDLTQMQTPHRHNPAEIVMESPTRPVHPSSTPSKLPTPRSGRGRGNRHEQDSLAPFSMASSQLLTKSQMLSDSLLDESVPGPPVFVGDSEDDDEL